jgi:hypothetical protein
MREIFFAVSGSVQAPSETATHNGIDRARSWNKRLRQ